MPKKELTKEEIERQSTIDFFSQRTQLVIQREQLEKEQAFLAKIGSREIEDPGYQKVKK